MARRGLRFAGSASAAWSRNTGKPDDARPARLVDRRKILDLAAKDPFGKKALNTLVNNAIGWGITGAPKGPKSIAKLWSDWTKVCDFNGRLDFYGLQELAVRTMFREGEVFIVLRTERVPVGEVPLRLQLLDAGMLATHLVQENIENGVEYDAEGRPVAYHFSIGRPGQRWANPRPVRVPAQDVIHLFVQEYVGQRHGISVFEPVVKRLGDIDESVEAEIIRKNIEACFAGFITPADGEGDEDVGRVQDQGPDKFATETLEPGMISRLRPGETVTFGDPKPSGGLNDIVKLALLSTAAGVGTTYEHISGDLSNVNYSSYRAGSLEFQRSIGRIQFNTIIPVGLERIWQRFQRDARERSIISARSYEIKWTPPPFESVDPEKEANGNIALMQAGLESRRNLVNARGYDFNTLMAEIAEDTKAQQGLGLLFKGDPFAPAQGGSLPEDRSEQFRFLVGLIHRLWSNDNGPKPAEAA
jgi:lambda family phage portal protein